MHTLPTHPRWCDTTRCEATLSRYGAHTSTPRTVAPDEISTVRAHARLWQRGDQPVYVELMVGDHTDGRRIRADLSVTQCGRLHTILGELYDAATGGAR